MKKGYIIQDLHTNLYWYGPYEEKKWTTELYEAEILSCLEECEQNIERLIGENNLLMLCPIKIYYA